ncbi:MAG: permease, partial [Lawsonibacter sp.]|nr:permease [Lawsonibacter sp.]
MQLLKTGWDFFQNQVLAMKWLNSVIGSGLSSLGLDL